MPYLNSTGSNVGHWIHLTNSSTGAVFSAPDSTGRLNRAFVVSDRFVDPYDGVQVSPAADIGGGLFSAQIGDIESGVQNLIYSDDTLFADLLTAADAQGDSLFISGNIILGDTVTGFGDIILSPDPSSGLVWFDYPRTALGGGATPTLGTIGGSGPATAAQNSWLAIVTDAGDTRWIPLWA